MKKYLFILILFLIPSVSASIIFEENFTDGNYTTDPAWIIDSAGYDTPSIHSGELYPVDNWIYTNGINTTATGDTVILQYTLNHLDGTYKNDEYFAMLYNPSATDYVLIIKDNNASGYTRYRIQWDSSTTGLNASDYVFNQNFSDTLPHVYKAVIENNTKTSYYIDDVLIIEYGTIINIHGSDTWLEMQSGLTSYADSGGSIDNISLCDTSCVTPTPTPTATPFPNLVQTGCGGQVSTLQIKDWFYALLFISCMIYVTGFFYTFGDKK